MSQEFESNDCSDFSQDPDSAYAELLAKEKEATLTTNITAQLPFIMVGVLMVFLSFFFPYAGNLTGLDVLFGSSTLNGAPIGLSERAYEWMALIGGVLLTIGSIVSRSTIVLMSNWFSVGIGWALGMFAVWLRQTDQSDGPSVGPSWGLLLGALGMTILFYNISIVLIRRSTEQKEISSQLRDLAGSSEQSRAAQQVLRTGLTPESHKEIEDDRRARAKQRRDRKNHPDDSPSHNS